MKKLPKKTKKKGELKNSPSSYDRKNAYFASFAVISPST